jgi:energy-coupling factor transporter transmembrane protein EcfT
MNIILISVLVLLLLLALFFLVRGFKLIFKKQVLKGLGYFLLTFLMFGIMFIITPQFGVERKSYPVADMKSNLRNLYLGCKEYWSEKGSEKDCGISMNGSDAYGFFKSSDVTLEFSGSEKNFSAKASHKNSEQVFTMNAHGEIR